MSNVHFIWWGPCPAPGSENLSKCIDMPVDTAKKCAGHHIVFWCSAAHEADFQKAIVARGNPNITVKGIKSIAESFAAVRAQGDNKIWFDDADSNLVILQELRAFSAIKDLLSLFILYCEGGFYFDTTTIITAPAKLNEMLSEPPTDVRVVELTDRGVNHQLGLQTGSAIATGVDYNAVEYLSQVQLIDVWALFAPPFTKTMELVYKSYVSRCNRMGLFPDGTAHNFEALLGTEIMGSDGRNDLIGNLIIRACYDGLISVACKGKPDSLDQFTWSTTDVPKEQQKDLGIFCLPAVGINKFHAGTWRKNN